MKRSLIPEEPTVVIGRSAAGNYRYIEKKAQATVKAKKSTSEAKVSGGITKKYSSSNQNKKMTLISMGSKDTVESLPPIGKTLKSSESYVSMKGVMAAGNKN